MFKKTTKKVNNSRRKSIQRNDSALGIEQLEPRKMFASISYDAAADVVSIFGDDWHDSATVNLVNNKVVVRITSTPSSGFVLTPRIIERAFSNPSDVDKIKFYGNAGNDSLVSNLRNIPVQADGGIGSDYIETYDAADTIYGGSGNDSIRSYGGNDTIYSGSGNDTIRGGTGNDRLYGGEDVDTLYGEDGHDSLHGGSLSSKDILYGGSGRDRFLTQNGDVIKDGNGITSRLGEDAQIRFVNRGESWSDKEIQVIDQAFAQLFAAGGDNRLLKETQGSAPLTFYNSDLTDGSAGYNKRFTYHRGCSGPWWDPNQVCDWRTRFHHRDIVIDEWDASVSTANANVVNTVIHEIGHNYDQAQIQTSIWNSFLNLSGWVQNPTNTRGLTRGNNFTGDFGDDKHRNWWRQTNNVADFARGYGGVNPFEDFATTWEAYFANGRSTYATNSTFAAKLRLIDQMVRNA